MVMPAVIPNINIKKFLQQRAIDAKCVPVSQLTNTTEVLQTTVELIMGTYLEVKSTLCEHKEDQEKKDEEKKLNEYKSFIFVSGSFSFMYKEQVTLMH